jgi:iron complex transport system ATP-binding protein
VDDDGSSLLALDEVRFGFPNRPDFLGPISLTVSSGQCLAVVGPNGAGKSTLLRLMVGLYKPRGGRIRLGVHPLETLSARRLARQVAFLPQGLAAGELDYTVRQIVLMGRFAHRSWSLFESTEDHRLAEQAMKTTGVIDFAERPVRTLSGGEAQRVHIAAALAQKPRVFVLDEPTSSLDLQHQLGIFQLLNDLAVRSRLAVVVVTHDVNLAARYGTKVLLLNEGRVVRSGTPEEVITPAVLQPVYGVAMATVTRHEAPDQRWIVPTGTSHEASA